MSYRRRGADELFIKNLIEEMKTREITDEEQERVEELFVEAYGYLPTNLCLSPHRLRRKWQQLEEGEAVEELGVIFKQVPQIVLNGIHIGGYTDLVKFFKKKDQNNGEPK